MLHDKDPKQYWKLIEELKDIEKIDTTSSISTSTWQSHFQNLNNPKDIFKNRIKWLEDKLSQLEKIKCFTDIDGKITEAEISSAIKEMKSNKSPGLDNISNEMLKSGQSFLIPCLHNFLITVLQWVITLKIGHMDILLQSTKGTIHQIRIIIGE
jgi:hypothetical protein